MINKICKCDGSINEMTGRVFALFQKSFVGIVASSLKYGEIVVIRALLMLAIKESILKQFISFAIYHGLQQ